MPTVDTQKKRMNSPCGTGGWSVFADTGGTFTDCLGRDPNGREHLAKVLSTGLIRLTVNKWEEKRCFFSSSTKYPIGFLCGSKCGDHEVVESGPDWLRFSTPPPGNGTTIELETGREAPVLGAHLITRTPLNLPLPPLDFRLATTRATNALLENKGAPTTLFVTAGFGDLLEIGDQVRPDLFALDIIRPDPLHTRSIEVDERLASDGSVLKTLNLESCHDAAQAAVNAGSSVAAVSLLHAYLNPGHERQLAEFLRHLGFETVVCGSDLSRLIRYLPRTETTVVDGYLTPVLQGYLAGVRRGLSENSTLRLMTSAGGLTRVTGFHPKDSLLSGPAGGAVGAGAVANQLGWTKVLTFDMGGTSTDVSRYHQSFSLTSTHRIGPARVHAPALAIETVAAGGGSICHVDQGALKVGPESGGARPGPACYGAGGPLCLTDVHLLLGRVDPVPFPIPIDKHAAKRAMDSLVNRHNLTQANVETYLIGFLNIANERMADAIRSVSVRKGHDPREHRMVAFGGAGGLHACEVADKLGITELFIPREAGLLSARGLEEARLEVRLEHQILKRWSDVLGTLRKLRKDLVNEATRRLDKQDGNGSYQVETWLELRYAGQESGLIVPYRESAEPDSATLFENDYARQFGSRLDRDIEVTSIRVRVSENTSETHPMHLDGSAPSPPPAADREARCWTGNKWDDVPFYQRDNLPSDAQIRGPALLGDPFAAVFLPQHWSARQIRALGMVCTREKTDSTKSSSPTPVTEPDSIPPEVEMELFTRRFRNIVELMGEQLRHTALSTNVKERRDYSCALLDPEGRLIASAPHIPVHLGALGLCVRTISKNRQWHDGDVILTNHPAFGGSHLPDLTVVTPVYHDSIHCGFVANRAHHAEIGGTRPGSMPPEASSLAEEGVVIAPTYLFRRGREQWDACARLLAGAPWPSRAVEENLADLRAQVAANIKGAELLVGLACEHGHAKIAGQMRTLTSTARDVLRDSITRIGPIKQRDTETFDDGSVIHLSLQVNPMEKKAVELNFSGTTLRHPANLNATPAIVNSAILYVLRLLARKDLPLNDGLLEPVKLILPVCFLNPEFVGSPDNMPPVVGGNVETSQRLVNLLLRAFRIQADSQGTMNNTVFGDDTFSYYETVCGGCGAGPSHDGASAVHSHMTNTAITDPEILEHRYPVRLRRFAIRRDSGGRGEHRGGDGVVRETEFLSPLSLSVLTQHRDTGPTGLAGGGDGSTGKQCILRDGTAHDLESLDQWNAIPGDILVMQTPGGGAWANAPDKAR